MKGSPMKAAIPFAIPLVLVALIGCAESPEPAANTAPVATAPVPGAIEAEPSIASATGTVESVDPDAGKITIAHDPVASLDWPAMTMRFKATSEQIASVQPGQAIRFDFEASGMDGTIVAIEPAD